MGKGICNWKFTDRAELFEIGGWNINKKGLLVNKPILKRGIIPFGVQAGVLTEDKLTDSIVEFLLAKKTQSGGSYSDYFEQKTKAEIDAEKRTNEAGTVELTAENDSTGDLEDDELVDETPIITPDKGGKKKK